jgi:hypothetical protein
MYISEIYVVMWLKKSSWFDTAFLHYTRVLSQIFITFSSRPRGLDLSLTRPPKRRALRATPPYKPKGCTCAGQNTSRVLAAITVSDSSLHWKKFFVSFGTLLVSTSWSWPRSLVLSPSKGGVLRDTPPYKPKGCTCAGQNTSRVLVAIAMLDSC